MAAGGTFRTWRAWLGSCPPCSRDPGATLPLRFCLLCKRILVVTFSPLRRGSQRKKSVEVRAGKGLGSVQEVTVSPFPESKSSMCCHVYY